MADLSTALAGIRSPNPFWLASSPATHRADQVLRAFEHGWGGAVWHTLHAQGSGGARGRYVVLPAGSQRVGSLGWTGPVLVRPVAEALADLASVKKAFADRALLCSVSGTDQDALVDLVKRAAGAGADGIELYLADIQGLGDVMDRTEWVVEAAGRLPVLVKLGARADVATLARSAVQAGAQGISAVDGAVATLGVDLGGIRPLLGGASRVGGSALKPLALQAVGALARDEEVGKPLSGAGGVASWQDAAEFLALGATTVQVCSAVITRGVHLIGELVEGLSDYLDENALSEVGGLVGRAWRTPPAAPPNHAARIDPQSCIGCGLCVVSCSDGSVDCIRLLQPTDSAFAAHAHALSTRANAPPPSRVPVVDTTRCIGCGLCQGVCPVAGCIGMVDLGA